MWFLFVVIFYINPQSGPEVEHVHIVKTFANKTLCQEHIDNIPSNEIPPFHNVGCVKWGDKVV
tara:strand:- start:11 stop:199 length:189 start_codon:yes stop_codon:yes gene_type:complete